MGLFDTKPCTFCRKEYAVINFFNLQSLSDGSLICSKCREKCSDDFDYGRKTTASMIREHMRAHTLDAQRFQKEFQKTRVFNSGGSNSKDCLYIDDNHGWWINATRKQPDIFQLDQIGAATIAISDTLRVTNAEERNQSKMYNAVASQFPNFPVASMEKYPWKLAIDVCILDHPFISRTKMEITLTDYDRSDVVSLQGICRAFYQMNEFFTAVQSSRHNLKRAQTMANAVVNAVAINKPESGHQNPLDQIKKLKELLDMGAITQEEYDSKKKELLRL